jgi:translocation and assembly module TamB
MWRVFHLSWITLVLLLAVPLAAVYFLGWTERGLAVVAGELNGKLGPVTLRITGASGTLARGLHVERLVIDHRRVHIEIEDATGRLAILPLAWQTIHTHDVHVARLLIHVLPHEDDHQYWEPRFLPGLISIVADGVSADHGRLIVPNGYELDANQLAASGVLHSRSIRIFGGKLDYQGAQLTADGTVLAASSIGLNGVLRMVIAPAGQPVWTANAHIDGDLARLTVNGGFTEPFAADFRGEAGESGGWHLAGNSQVQRFDLGAWGLGNPLGIITGRLAVRLDDAGFTARGALTPPGLKSGPLDVDFGGTYGQRAVHISHLSLHHPAAGATLTAQGSVGIEPGGPRLDLRGDWRSFRWPLTRADAELHSGGGSYQLRGVRPFELTAEGDLRAGDLPALQIDGTASLDVDRIEVTDAAVGVYGGHAQFSGDAVWAPPTSWSVNGRMTGLELAQLRPGFTGRLNFALAASGHHFAGDTDIDARLSDLSGTVRNLRAGGSAHIARTATDWLFDGVNVTLGSTHIAAEGRAGTALDLRFAVDTQDLALLADGAAGRLNAHGTLRGTGQRHSLVLSAQGEDLTWEKLRLSKLAADVDFEPTGSGRADARIRLDNLNIGDRLVPQLALTIAGTTAEHQLALDARMADITLAARGVGHYDDGWNAEIRTFNVDGQNLRLRIEQPAAFGAAAGRYGLSALCLRDEGARLCASAAGDATVESVAMNASHLPMRELTAGLTPGTDYDGTLSIDASGSAREGGPWRGQLTAELDGAAVHRRFPSGRVETLNLGTGRVEAQMDQSMLAAKVALDAGAAGRIDATLTASGLDTDWHEWPLAGTFALRTDAIGFVDSYVTQIDRAVGRIDANLTVGGTVAAPRLSGELNLANAEFDLYQINLGLRQVNFRAQLTDDALALNGSFAAGSNGHADLSGNLRWRGGLPFGEVRLKGDELRVVNIPEARVDASPDVTLKLDGRRIDAAGEVTLPYARLERSQLANVVLASGDETMVGDGPASPEEQFHVFSDITLRLGDRVTVDTLGLSGRLSGSLRVTSDDTGISRGTGELNVEEGKYSAYGRKLDVERGRLLFSNGLLSDPGIDLRATKVFPDITAGVNVRGTLRSPRMTFFSDPPVTQSQIVSLLLAGGTLESVQNSSTASGGAARSGLVQGGAIVAQQLGNKVGIEDVSVESDLTNDTSLVLGRYLSPRLYISYGIGLAEALNTIKMRYTIGDHWTVKTEAGTNRSADLVYTIEK